jgi:hypothetical protein
MSLDTRGVLWLHAGLVDRFTSGGRRLPEQNDMLRSPTVKLERQCIVEIYRSTVLALQMISEPTTAIQTLGEAWGSNRMSAGIPKGSGGTAGGANP